MIEGEPTTQPRIELVRPGLFALIEDERDLPLIPLALTIGQVTAISVAPATADTDAMLRRAFALGAERVVRIWDPVLSEVDYLAIAHILACAVRHLCDANATLPIIVLSTDRGRAAVGPAVAERLQVPHLGAVHRLELQRDLLLVDRQVGGDLRRYRGSPPVVLACAVRALETPLAPKPETEERPIAVLDLAALQVTGPELQYRRRFRPILGEAPRRRAHLVSDVERLSDRLERDGLWPLQRSAPKPASVDPLAHDPLERPAGEQSES